MNIATGHCFSQLIYCKSNELPTHPRVNQRLEFLKMLKQIIFVMFRFCYILVLLLFDYEDLLWWDNLCEPIKKTV